MLGCTEGVSVSVYMFCVCVCVCVCVSSKALTVGPNSMKFHANSLEDMGQCSFSQILDISIR